MPHAPVLVDVEDGGGGGEGEGVRGAVADLAERRRPPGDGPGQQHAGDEFAGLDDGVALRVVTGQPVEVRRGHAAGRPAGAAQFHVGVAGGERHGDVGGVGGDAVRGVPEHGVVAVDAVPCAAAASGERLLQGLDRS